MLYPFELRAQDDSSINPTYSWNSLESPLENASSRLIDAPLAFSSYPFAR